MGQNLVTVKEFAKFAAERSYHTGECFDHSPSKRTKLSKDGWKNPGFTQTPDDPVTCISYEDAQNYINWLNTKPQASTGTVGSQAPYRLPTEFELEHAVGAGRNTLRWWGDAMEKYRVSCAECANYSHNGTTDVFKFPPNPFNIYDPLGNLWQMTSTCADNDNKLDRIMKNVIITITNDKNFCYFHLVEGGSFASRSWTIFSSARAKIQWDYTTNTDGFRVVRDAAVK